MSLAQHLRLASRHLARGGWLARSRTAWLLAHERDDRAAMLDWQAQRLQRTLQAAARRLPAYRKLQGKLQGKVLGSLPALEARALLREDVPVLDKAALREGRALYYPAQGLRHALWPAGLSSGTTGAPLEVFRSLDAVIWEQAFLYQHWSWAGHRPGVRQAVLRGDTVVPLSQTRPPYWQRDLLAQSLSLSTRHLRRDTVGAMVEAVRAFGARQLRAYPSSAWQFARLVREQGLALKFESIQTSSEMLYPVQRELIEQVFGARVFDLYGMAERVAMGMGCEHGRMHLNLHYSDVEILDEQGRPTDGVGQLVGTTLHNRVMPLLRYRLSDHAQWDPEPCPCGRGYPVVKLSAGKVEDEVFDLDGAPVSPSVITFAFKGIEGVDKAQVSQVAQDRWELRVVPGAGYDEATEAALLQNFERLVSRRLRVQVCRCEQIPNLPSGKFKWVMQEWAGATVLHEPGTNMSKEAASAR